MHVLSAARRWCAIVACFWPGMVQAGLPELHADPRALTGLGSGSAPDDALTGTETLINPAFGWLLTPGSATDDRLPVGAMVWRTAPPCPDGAGCFAARLDVLAPVPEPSAYAMLAVGIAVLGLYIRRRDTPLFRR